MSLVIVPPDYVDWAWRNEGADCLAEACELVEEITASQLKLLLSRGERYLAKMMDGDKAVGWGTFKIDNLPNMRVLHVTDLTAHNGHFENFFSDIKEIARNMGCAEVRCSCPPAQARLYRMKCNFKPVYETLKVEV